jgi:tetratricopeptide (TPR) repeat protein
MAPQLERRRLERGFSVLVCAVALVAVIGAFAKFGSPVSIATNAWHSFKAPPSRVTTSLNTRLFSFSGSDRAELWRVAIHDVRAHPILGSGAGTYAEEWLANRRITTQVVNAHNLYLETLAELGPVGLALLLLVLVGPLLAAVRARRRPLVPVAAAAYLAFLVHAAVDWDWQLPAVTLAALFTGCAILAAARADVREIALGRLARRSAVAIALTISVVAAIGLLGNRAAASATNDTNHRNWQQAEAQAHRATELMPWSSIGWEDLGDAEYQQGKLAEARASYSTAIAKDPHNWQLWLDLALVTTGNAEHKAALRAQALNPLSSEIACIAPRLNLKVNSRLC